MPVVSEIFKINPIYTYIFTPKMPGKHENIELICKNTDTSDTLDTS